MGSDDSKNVDEHERVLGPDELDITSQPEVAEIDDGRYVVSPSGPAKKPNPELLENPDWLGNDADDADDADDSNARQQPSTDRPNHGGGDSTQPPQPQNSHSPQHSTHSKHPQESQQPQQSDHPAQSTPSETAHSAGQPPAHPDPGATQSTGGRADTPAPAAHDQPPADSPTELTHESVGTFLAQSLAQRSDDYGFDATLKLKGQTARGRMTSDDVGEPLETLLRWYAKRTTDEVDPERFLGIILAGSDLAVEYPVQSAYDVVKQHDLGPDDSIGDLLSAIRDDGSFTVPPSKS